MAATAQEKAYNLKDSYVAGLIEGGATAPIQGMPETGMGELASIINNVDTGKRTYINDGIPEQVSISPSMGRKEVYESRASSMPINRSDIHSQHNKFGFLRPSNENVYTTVTDKNSSSSGYGLGVPNGFMEGERRDLANPGRYSNVTPLTAGDMRRYDPELNPGMKRVRVKGQSY